MADLAQTPQEQQQTPTQEKEPERRPEDFGSNDAARRAVLDAPPPPAGPPPTSVLDAAALQGPPAPGGAPAPATDAPAAGGSPAPDLGPDPATDPQGYAKFRTSRQAGELAAAKTPEERARVLQAHAQELANLGQMFRTPEDRQRFLEQGGGDAMRAVVAELKNTADPKAFREVVGQLMSLGEGLGRKHVGELAQAMAGLDPSTRSRLPEAFGAGMRGDRGMLLASGLVDALQTPRFGLGESVANQQGTAGEIAREMGAVSGEKQKAYRDAAMALAPKLETLRGMVTTMRELGQSPEEIDRRVKAFEAEHSGLFGAMERAGQGFGQTLEGQAHALDTWKPDGKGGPNGAKQRGALSAFDGAMAMAPNLDLTGSGRTIMADALTRSGNGDRSWIDTARDRASKYDGGRPGSYLESLKGAAVSSGTLGAGALQAVGDTEGVRSTLRGVASVFGDDAEGVGAALGRAEQQYAAHVAGFRGQAGLKDKSIVEGAGSAISGVAQLQKLDNGKLVPMVGDRAANVLKMLGGGVSGGGALWNGAMSASPSLFAKALKEGLGISSAGLALGGRALGGAGTGAVGNAVGIASGLLKIMEEGGAGPGALNGLFKSGEQGLKGLGGIGSTLDEMGKLGAAGAGSMDAAALSRLKLAGRLSGFASLGLGAADAYGYFSKGQLGRAGTAGGMPLAGMLLGGVAGLAFGGPGGMVAGGAAGASIGGAVGDVAIGLYDRFGETRPGDESARRMAPGVQSALEASGLPPEVAARLAPELARVDEQGNVRLAQLNELGRRMGVSTVDLIRSMENATPAAKAQLMRRVGDIRFQADPKTGERRVADPDAADVSGAEMGALGFGNPDARPTFGSIAAGRRMAEARQRKVDELRTRPRP